MYIQISWSRESSKSKKTCIVFTDGYAFPNAMARIIGISGFRDRPEITRVAIFKRDLIVLQFTKLFCC